MAENNVAPTRKFGIISLVCGIASICLSYGPFIGVIVAIVGIVMSGKAASVGDESKMPKVGKILSIIGLVLSVILSIIWLIIIIAAAANS